MIRLITLRNVSTLNNYLRSQFFSKANVSATEQTQPTSKTAYISFLGDFSLNLFSKNLRLYHQASIGNISFAAHFWTVGETGALWYTFSLWSCSSIVSGNMKFFLISADSSSFILYMNIFKLIKYCLFECVSTGPTSKIMGRVETVTKTLVV